MHLPTLVVETFTDFAVSSIDKSSFSKCSLDSSSIFLSSCLDFFTTTAEGDGGKEKNCEFADDDIEFGELN